MGTKANVTPGLFGPINQWQAKILRMERLMAGYLATQIAPYIVQFTIGDGNPGTPANGAVAYPNPLLAGKTVKVFKNGSGYLTQNTDYTLGDDGTITLLGGAVFSTAETYVIWAY